MHPSTAGSSILAAVWKRLFLRPSTHARTHVFLSYSATTLITLPMCAFIDGKTIYRHVSKYVYEVGRYKSAIGMPNLQNRFLMIFYA